MMRRYVLLLLKPLEGVDGGLLYHHWYLGGSSLSHLKEGQGFGAFSYLSNSLFLSPSLLEMA